MASGFVGSVVPLAKETFREFQRHKAGWLAAAIAYFSLFAIAPLVIVIVEISGAALGSHRAVLAEFYQYLSKGAGTFVASAIQSIVAATFKENRSGMFAQIVAWAAFIIAAAGLFSALQQAMDTVWDVSPPKRSFFQTLLSRAAAFPALAGVAFLLLVSVFLNTALALAANYLGHIAPFFPPLLGVGDFVASVLLAGVLFGFLFAYLPDYRLGWRDVWTGAGITALLFVVGQCILGWYLGRAGTSSAYGVFGALVVFLLWANYSAQIFLFGAEFTRMHALRNASAADFGERTHAGSGLTQA